MEQELRELLTGLSNQFVAVNDRLDAINVQMTDFSNRLEAVEGRLVNLDNRLEVLDGWMEALEGKLDAVEDRLDAIEGRLDAVEGRLDAIEGRLDAIEDRLDAVESRLDALEAYTKDLGEQVDLIKKDLTILKSRATKLENRMKSMEDGMSDRFDELSADLDELRLNMDQRFTLLISELDRINGIDVDPFVNRPKTFGPDEGVHESIAPYIAAAVISQNDQSEISRQYVLAKLAADSKESDRKKYEFMLDMADKRSEIGRLPRPEDPDRLIEKELLLESFGRLENDFLSYKRIPRNLSELIEMEDSEGLLAIEKEWELEQDCLRRLIKEGRSLIKQADAWLENK